MKSVTIVTPTIGSRKLWRCLDSVQRQSYPNIKHLVVCDGAQHLAGVTNCINIVKHDDPPHEIQLLPIYENVGKAFGQSFYSHRAYAAACFLVNSDYIVFLDEDNWLEPFHVESLVNAIEFRNLDWAYALRNVYDDQMNFVAQDNCESLGKWGTWVNNDHRMVDTSCYMIKRDPIAIRAGGVWYGGWGQDRVWFSVLEQHFPNYDCTGLHTMNYGLGGNPDSVKAEFFVEGNQIMLQRYGGTYPWVRTSDSTEVVPT